MREIKFRAWDEINNSWVYMDIEDVCKCMYYGDTSGLPINSVFNFTQQEQEKEKGTLKHFCLYIGRRDKNHKEIYKGDIINAQIIESRSVSTKGEVVFDKEHSLWGNKNLGGITPLWKLSGIEIIGNICESPLDKGAT